MDLSAPLRPYCLARERLILWRPTITCNTSFPFTLIDAERIYEVIGQAWADLTKETYGSGLLLYHTFCNLKKVPEDWRAPALHELVASFISTLAGTYAGSTVTNCLSAVHAWHTIHGIPWEFNSDEIVALMKVARGLAPPSSKRSKREPYTIDIIAKIRAQLSLSKPLDAAVFACLTTTFFATAQVGESTVPNLTAFNPLTHVTRKHVEVLHDCQNLEITNLFLPHTKSAPQGENVNWAKQDGPVDPQEALANHFCFLKVIETAGKKAGVPPLKGHGIRIGLTLEYLLRNIPFETVKVKGQWASNAFLIYLRIHAQILAPYMQAKPAVHKAFLQFTIPPSIHR
ncbi:hypothetical protein OG21DRAFT_1565348 [Imleria badia]|nr:hypothetical protein OG21DRAFT_1565348 [Imleria badia]